jgi:hypothetical protein
VPLVDKGGRFWICILNVAPSALCEYRKMTSQDLFPVTLGNWRDEKRDVPFH